MASIGNVIREFGPVRGAGVLVQERGASGSVQQSDVGCVAVIGRFERGAVNTPADPQYNLCSSERAASRILGGRYEGFKSPYVKDHFWKYGQGAGKFIGIRVTDGDEEAAEMTLFTRHRGTDFRVTDALNGGQAQVKLPCLKVTAKNGGRWASRQRIAVGDMPTSVAASLTELTLATGLTTKKDEFAGATLTLEAVSWRTYEVVSNTTAGVLTVKTGSTMLTDAGAGVTRGFVVSLENEELATNVRKALAVRVVQPSADPTLYFGLHVYVDGVVVKKWDQLSMNPASPWYVETLVNDDLSNYEIEVEDLLPTGIALVADHMPANWYGRLKSVTTTTATFCPAQVSSVDDPVNVRIVEIVEPASAELVPHRLTFTWDLAATKYVVTASELGRSGVQFGALPDFAVGAAPQIEVNYTADNPYTVGVTIDHPTGDPLDGTTFVLDVLPVNDLCAPGGYIVGKAQTLPGTQARIASATHKSVTVEAGDLTSMVTAPTAAQVIGSVAEPYAIVLATNDAVQVNVANREAITVTLTAGGAVTAAAIAAEINAAFDAVYGAGVLHPASVLVDLAGDKFLQIDDPAYEGGGPGSVVEILTVAHSAYATLGFAVGTTRGTAGSEQQLIFGSEPGSGHDGGTPTAQDYLDALAIATSPLNKLAGKGLGVLQFATPEVTTTAVQKAGIQYAEARNHLYYPLVPNSTTTEDAALAYKDGTIGVSELAAYFWPSYGFVPDPDGGGSGITIELPLVGMIMGLTSRRARDNRGYHVAAAGVDAKLYDVVDLPTGDMALDEETLTPRGVNVIKKVGADFVIWGGRVSDTSSLTRWLKNRLQTSHFEHTLQEQLVDVVFRNNDPLEWAELKTRLADYFYPQYELGMFKGSGFANAVTIKVDAENNPDSEQVAGNMHADVSFALVDMIERLVIGVSNQGAVTESAA